MKYAGVCPNGHIIVVEVMETKQSQDRYAMLDYSTPPQWVGCPCGYSVDVVQADTLRRALEDD